MAVQQAVRLQAVIQNAVCLITKRAGAEPRQREPSGKQRGRNGRKRKTSDV